MSFFHLFSGLPTGEAEREGPASIVNDISRWQEVYSKAVRASGDQATHDILLSVLGRGGARSLSLVLSNQKKKLT